MNILFKPITSKRLYVVPLFNIHKGCEFKIYKKYDYLNFSTEIYPLGKEIEKDEYVLDEFYMILPFDISLIKEFLNHENCFLNIIETLKKENYIKILFSEYYGDTSSKKLKFIIDKDFRDFPEILKKIHNFRKLTKITHIYIFYEASEKQKKIFIRTSFKNTY